MGTQSTRPEDDYSDKFAVYWKPDQDFVYIGRRFYAEWENVIRGRDVVFAIDPTGYARNVTVGYKEHRPAFIEGFEHFGEDYELKGKSYVKFKYVQPLTFYFRIFDEDGNEIQYPNHVAVPEVIDLESDSESESEEIQNEEVAPPNGGAIKWDKVVTKRIVDGREALNLPATVVMQLRRQSQKMLTVRVVNRNKVQDCSIRQAKRNRNEAYLTQGWHGLCKALKLHVGDKLFFSFEENELQLFVLSMPTEFVVVVQ